ncbi:acyl-CoA dehydrogenase [Frondihabitans sucicola]|uniref:Acyl-CoA dehydrogenase n=1 Tax=Frondihabitans sucicola TaxID=1268041 RepID=A0ABN6Y2V2_9MICO|nr:acyl-CoA dehydrogenase [Frondihabitans sucicola]BDZ50048.1 acyl-CoA dehydrogenase [Frondihabitans sucicola]
MNRVALAAGDPGPVTRETLAADPHSVREALDLGVALGPLRPFVGHGATRDVWEALASLAASDLALARTLEPHLDALTILDQAGITHVRGGTWGVYAAEAPGLRLEAVETRAGWRLTGTKPWCSLAGSLSDALVTAWVDDTRRQLFRVSLQGPTIGVPDSGWHARGLSEIPSGDVTFDGAACQPVGAPGWYLERAGFAWGSMSVAACWFGGAVGVARALLDASRTPGRDTDAILLMHVGTVDARLTEARTALEAAARTVDAGEAAGSRGGLLAKRVRSTVARCAEAVIREVGHALGPGPLAKDAEHGKRVADLDLYVRQHHGERDDLSLGKSVRDSDDTW